MSFIKAKDIDKIKTIYIEEIHNPKYEDLLTVGNIVILKNKKIKISVDTNETNWIKRESNVDIMLVEPLNNVVSYVKVNANYYKNTFPKCVNNNNIYFSDLNIVKVYKTNIDENSLNSFDEFKKIYKKYKNYIEEYL